MPLTGNGLPYPVRTGVPPDVQKDIKDLADALDPYVGDTPGARLLQNNVQSVPNATVAPLVFDTPDQLRGGMTVGASGVIVPRAGWYAVSAASRWASNATGSRQVRIVQNTSTRAIDVDSAASGSASRTIGCILYCGVGDEVLVHVYQSSGGALGTFPDHGMPFLTVAWLGR